MKHEVIYFIQSYTFTAYIQIFFMIRFAVSM